ncbi:uncharacterized protein BO66DRAFT_385974 [Aspergillus aculeatinus CBS 121060]|uniref:Uncharacterized protein n=1 Tax=Aspergillus aculeatinus CBS 121060 TaxID=1448322 RepID=A0ACD1GSR3_9EURO|nr:hypothetical protein BO66DRAFT_385974 [Aspergillus aculeatinus CBS 121060]RAH64233.1 hypothetical protein BO66DRAFT_385974 [Aspergillus aculeatinus CBS 121060]
MDDQDNIFTRDEPLSEQEHAILANYATEPRYSHGMNKARKPKIQRTYFDTPKWVLNSGHQEPNQGADQPGGPLSLRQDTSRPYAPFPEGSNVSDGANHEQGQNRSLGYEMTSSPLGRGNDFDFVDSTIHDEGYRFCGGLGE